LPELVKIVEKKPIPSGATMLYGLPDVGLVGLIATSYLISELDSEEIAYMKDSHTPLSESTETKTLSQLSLSWRFLRQPFTPSCGHLSIGDKQKK
jgi:hypothetical protein